MAFSNPTAPYTAADLASMIPEVWSPIVNEANFPAAVASNFFTDLSDYMTEGGDRVHVPDIFTNVFTAQTQTTQGNAVVDASPASVDVYLDVDTHKYVAYIIGDKDMKQLASKYSLNEKYAKESQNVLINALEASLFGLYSSLTTNTVGDTATVLSDAEIVEAIEKLESLDYKTQLEGAFFFHPFVYWRQVSTIAKYYSQSISQLPIIRDGNFGKMDVSRGLRGQVYGIPIYTSTNVVKGLSTYRNILAVPSAFGFAIQTGNGKVRVQSDYLLQNLGTLTVADIIYGVAVLREPAAVLINANDTAITS
jgi:CBS domain-containing protein